MITLDSFLQKIREKEENKVRVVVLEVEGIGEIEFVRPKESDLLAFNNQMLKCYQGDMSEMSGNKIDISQMDMEHLSGISSELIYKCCSLFSEKKVRDMYVDVEFYQIPLMILGASETIKIASELNDKFKGVKVAQETEKAIKN